MRFSLLPVLAFVTLVPAAARADGRDATAADALFQSAKEAMGRGDYASACPRFAESHRLDPAPGTLLNLAQCEEKQGKLASAQTHLTEALEKLPKDDFRVSYVQETLVSLRKRVPTVTVTLDALSSGAHVERDGIELRSATFGIALPLDPGAHVFTVRAAGRAGSRKDIVLREGEQISLTLGAGPSSDSAPAADNGGKVDVSTSSGGGSGKRTLAIASFAVGGAGLATGIVTGLLTASAASKYKDHCNSAGCDADGQDAASQGKTMGIISPIGFGVGVLGAGLGTYFLLTSNSSSSAPAQTTGSLVVAPHVSGRDASLSLSGSF